MIDIVKFNIKLITILIWTDEDWKIVEANVSYDQTKNRIKYHFYMHKMLHFYDLYDNFLFVEQCFDAV